MSRYLVAFERRPFEPSMDRAALVRIGTERTAEDVGAMQEFVGCAGMASELASVGEPLCFGMVGIVATQRLADRLSAAPRVRSVVRD